LIAYRLATPKDLVIDGKLDDPSWQEVGFSSSFVDISTSRIPRLQTNVKLRYDDEYLYVGAFLEEPQVAANISHTCHCIDPDHDQVIFHDNDFEIFVDADGSTHNYKEFEMNASNLNGTSATWDLLLNKPYDDGGFENSTRVFGSNGWDMIPPGHCRTYTDGVLNDPYSNPTFWSAEVALPLRKLAEKTIATVPVASGSYWRINFSRVEWAMKVVNGKYQQYPSCQSCPVPGSPQEDNWVFSPMGAIAMHLPEKWAFLQFSSDPVNSTSIVKNPEWPVRSVASALYYAQHEFSNANQGIFTDNINLLIPYAPVDVFSCMFTPQITLSADSKKFVASITSFDGAFTATITDDRYLRVFENQIQTK
jgi:hypothetical protein